MTTRKRQGSASAATPLGYFAVALVAIVAVLPSALRPPQNEASTTAQFSPDAPPDDVDSIVANLQRATSGTPGSGGAGGEAEAPGAPVEDAPPPPSSACPFGFGDPPRQTESPYAPPCAPAFSGDNGGVTGHNVLPNEVRVGFWHGAVTIPEHERGLVPTEPQPGETDVIRTMRVLQAYFNTHYQLWGRTLRLDAVRDSSTEAEQRASAIQQNENKDFAVTHLFTPFCEEATRLQMVCMNINPNTKPTTTEHRPYWWTYLAAWEDNDVITADYLCSKLVGRPAEFAGGLEAGKPRVIGIITETKANNEFHGAGGIERALKDRCGYDPPVAVEVSIDEPQGNLSTAITRMRQAGVTTILFHVEFNTSIALMSNADASTYFPEWVHVASFGADLNDFARYFPPTQSQRLFGLSTWEVPRPFSEYDCYRAYKAIDPAGEPDFGACEYYWAVLELVVAGIQLAGPELNGESFERGLFALGHRRPAEPWAIGGGYGPGDHAYIENYVEQWWDPTATDPINGEQGAYRFTEGGRRRSLGEFDDVTRVFRDGVTSTSG
jgi:hypothetical protein